METALSEDDDRPLMSQRSYQYLVWSPISYLWAKPLPLALPYVMCLVLSLLLVTDLCNSQAQYSSQPHSSSVPSTVP